MTTIMSTHLMTPLGLLHIKGTREETIDAVQKYFRESGGPDMFIHFTLLTADGEEEIAMNPSQIIFIGREHSVTLNPVVAAAAVRDGDTLDVGLDD